MTEHTCMMTHPNMMVASNMIGHPHMMENPCVCVMDKPLESLCVTFTFFA